MQKLRTKNILYDIGHVSYSFISKYLLPYSSMVDTLVVYKVKETVRA